MLLALSSMITEMDRYSEENLGVPVRDLMERAGHAVANCVKRRVDEGSSVLILCGKGNNGGDGYACAIELLGKYSVRVYDVFRAGQRSEEGNFFLERFKSLGGEVLPLNIDDEFKKSISECDCIVDAIFGTGFIGQCPPLISELASLINAACSEKIAIDIPLGINADNGSVNMEGVCSMSCTVALGYLKPGLVSFPAKAYVGEIVFDDLGFDLKRINSIFDFKYKYVDSTLAVSLLPEREENSSKGSFGKLLCLTGSKRYRGAARLSLEAALRGGVGLVTFASYPELAKELSADFPEAIYMPVGDDEDFSDEELSKIVSASKSHSATLVGCGSGNTEQTEKLVKALLSSEGGTLVIDADGINALCRNRDEGVVALKEAKRKVILTPHPLEFARISGSDVSFVQLHRIEAAIRFAAENEVILVLKGAATIVTDGKTVYINSSGSSALAKGGSGDVLAGFLASLVASGVDPLCACAIAAYYHGAAADTLALEYSSLGVTPSDLPKQIAREVSLSLGNGTK